MRERGYNIDWTANLEKEDARGQDPWDSLKCMRPCKGKPAGSLGEYSGTRYDIFTVYLARKGIPMTEPVRAYASGHFKMMECRDRLYLTMVDGLVYEKDKLCCRGWDNGR